MKKYKKFFLLLAAAVFLSGCGLFEERKDDATAESSSLTEEPSPYPVIIDDVTLSASPERIVCLSPSLCEILYEFGEGGRLVGRSGYCDYPPEIKKVRDLGKGVGANVDGIAALSPDLLLTSAPIPAKDKVALESAGVKTLTLPPPGNLGEFGEIYRLVGVILYGSFTGEEEGESVFSVISRACDNSGAVNLGKFVYITENLAAATGDTLESSVLSCFGSNVAQNASGYVFDKNVLTEKQPDVVLLNGAYDVDVLLADEVYSELDAVKNGRIIIIDNTCFERPSARVVGMINSVITEYNMMKGQ